MLLDGIKDLNIIFVYNYPKRIVLDNKNTFVIDNCKLDQLVSAFTTDNKELNNFLNNQDIRSLVYKIQKMIHTDIAVKNGNIYFPSLNLSFKEADTYLKIFSILYLIITKNRVKDISFIEPENGLHIKHKTNLIEVIIDMHRKSIINKTTIITKSVIILESFIRIIDYYNLYDNTSIYYANNNKIRPIENTKLDELFETSAKALEKLKRLKFMKYINNNVMNHLTV